MKKILVSLMAFLYLTSSCEATVYVHYCMGKQVSFSFLPDNSSHCQRCGMKKSVRGMGCCKDEQKIFRTDKNQKLTDLSLSAGHQKKFTTVNTAFHDFTEISLAYTPVSYSPSHGPPGFRSVPVYVMNCLFLI